MIKAKEMDLTKGNLLKQMILYALPILGVNVLQLLFTTADTVVLGLFVSAEKQTSAVGGVGATGPVTNLLLGLFVGIGIGATVSIAKAKGENNLEKARRAVGSSLFVGLLLGIFLAIVFFFGARTILSLMNCKENLLDMATRYLKIYSLGIPIIIIYNYEAAILRAVGETTKPLIFLLIGGTLNVILNVVCVVVFKMDTDGVAIATVVSNFISALCCFITLKKSTGFARFDFKYFKFSKELKEIIYIGVMSGLHKIVFSISNIIVASALNGLGQATTAGNSVAHTFDAYINEVGEAFAISVLSFVSQNVGAKNNKRAVKSVFMAIRIILVVESIVAIVVLILNRKLCGIVSNDEEVLKIAMMRLYIVAPTYFLVATYSSLSYFLRGIGKNGFATFISILGGFVFRILFITLVKMFLPNNVLFIYLTYPLTWLITFILFLIASIYFGKKFLKTEKETLL